MRSKLGTRQPGALARGTERHHTIHRCRVTGVAAARDAQQVGESPHLVGLIVVLPGIEIQQHHFQIVV